MNNIINVENIIFCLGILITLIFIIIGIILLNKNKKCTCKTTGKVIDNVQRKAKDTNNHWRYYWHSLCEYNVDGVKCIKETIIGTMQPKYKLGQTVEIYYNPKNYHESYIVGDRNSKALGYILIALGLLNIFMLLILI